MLKGQPEQRNDCVSVGLPVYNGERHLGKALESILSQTYVNIEVVVSDNASTDGTEDICQGYALRDRRIRYYRQRENLGAARNFNIVLELSTGQYFKWMGYDDWLAPTFLNRCVSALESDPSTVLCYCSEGHYTPNGRFVCSLTESHHVVSARAAARFRQILWSRSSIDPTYAVVRRDALLKAAPISTLLCTDDVLAAELGLAGRFGHINEQLSFRTAQPRTDAERMDRIEPSARTTRGQFSLACIAYSRVIARSGLRLPEKATLWANVAWFFVCAQIRRRFLGLGGARDCPEALRRVHQGLDPFDAGDSVAPE